ncbi:MAG: hypothetical protein JO209_11350 [Acidisphaera sp.]|nr:hypothetical protein [Acidisphaera sp.]
MAGAHYPVRCLTFPGGYRLSPEGLAASGYFDGGALRYIADANAYEGDNLFRFCFSNFDGFLSDEPEGQAERFAVLYYRRVRLDTGESPAEPGRVRVFGYDAGRQSFLPAAEIVATSPGASGTPVCDHAGGVIGHRFETAAGPVAFRAALRARPFAAWFQPDRGLGDPALRLDADGSGCVPQGAQGDFLAVFRADPSERGARDASMLAFLVR